ncbi:hypothetical protein FB451DRAFT_1395722 [Mycena latifolia]|nr:hypothetical protein FB451DRAFT_1395722 [Mycena latifolia]
MRSAPIIRARIFSFIYYGLKRLNMHAVVEVIPLLLHASLIFFACLVAFLMPVNYVMVVVSSVLLTLVVVVYSSLTILPLFYLDCPYRTPLSGVCWQLLQSVREPSANRRLPTTSKDLAAESDTVVEAVFHAATRNSAARDQRTLSLTLKSRLVQYPFLTVWTVKSLAGECELEPFVEGVHDGVLGADVLITRIEGLLRSADSGLLPEETAARRRITCLKALWAIASLAERENPVPALSARFDLELIYPLALPAAREIRHYALSTLALARWANLCAIDSSLS